MLTSLGGAMLLIGEDGGQRHTLNRQGQLMVTALVSASSWAR